MDRHRARQRRGVALPGRRSRAGNYKEASTRTARPSSTTRGSLDRRRDRAQPEGHRRRIPEPQPQVAGAARRVGRAAFALRDLAPHLVHVEPRAAATTCSSAAGGSAPACAKTTMLSRKTISVGIDRCRNARDLGLGLGVDLREQDVRMTAARLEHRRERPARRAPRRPEVDDRERMAGNRAELRGVERGDLAGELGTVAG